jgi:hypothetical protein
MSAPPAETDKQRMLRARLAELIAAMAPGEPLPAERDLARELGVARMTLRRAVDGMVAEALRAARAPVLAVDVPSGLDGETGAVRGYAPRAEVSVTFFRLKPGHLLLPGRELCGEVVLADIGLPASVLPAVGPRAFRSRPGLWALPTLAAGGHKYTRGHLTVVGGGAMTGATRLAAGAAHRAGAGLVTVAAPDAAAAAVYRAGEPETIVSTEPVAALLEDERRAVWLLGPGLPPAPETRDALRRVIEAKRKAVADAGALLACAETPDALSGAAVLTPHAGEFARVFGPVGADKPAAARAAAARACAPRIVSSSPQGWLGTSDGTSTPLTVTPGARGTITARTAPTFTGLSDPTATTRTS